LIKYDTQAPYLASYIIVRRDRKVGFLLRSNTKWMNGFYTLPGGKTEWNETLTATAAREALEEIGITVKSDGLRPLLAMHRYTGGENSHWIDMFFEMVTYEGEPYNAEPHMHAEFVWLDPANLPDNVVQNVKFGLEEIAAGKTYTEFGWAG
jgi:8-oxo-dGTP diphosphatase